MLTSNSTTVNVANIMSEFLPYPPSLDLTCLLLVPTGFGQPKLMAQFDGSAHRSRHIGGAGAALFQVDSTGMTLLDWGSQALPNCVDNIIAEGKGACLAITLYERYVEHCLQSRILPFPLDTIQGDIWLVSLISSIVNAAGLPLIPLRSIDPVKQMS